MILNRVIRLVKSILVIVITLSISHGCVAKKTNNSSNESSCLALKIETFKKTACAQGASVTEYQFENKTVYTLAPGNCGADMSTEVITKNCETLGYLGGLMGNTKINGIEFSQAKKIKTIWEQVADEK